jgi:hypothetical protein
MCYLYVLVIKMALVHPENEVIMQLKILVLNEWKCFNKLVSRFLKSSERTLEALAS